MTYKADINELPLNVFIEVYTNEHHRVEFDIPVEEAVRKVVGEYMSIVGGKQVASAVVNANRRLNLVILIECMIACEDFIAKSRWSDACQVLGVLGYPMGVDEHDRIHKRVQALKTKAQYDLSKEHDEEQPTERVSKESFVRERVTVMKYNKMQIDPNAMTAGEYAWLVKQTCDEIEELNRKHKK